VAKETGRHSVSTESSRFGSDCHLAHPLASTALPLSLHSFLISAIFLLLGAVSISSCICTLFPVIMNTAIDTQQEEQHLRHLLGQRSARTNTHGRLFSMSDLSDTPSMYSTAFFSPQTHAPFDVDTRTIASDYGPPRPEFDAIQRVILDDPSASAVDFSEDPRMSYASNAESYASDKQLESDLSDDEVRMSMLGPKMRFHSRAPWETGEDLLLDENDPPVDISRSKSPSIFHRGRGDNVTKGASPTARSRSKGPAEVVREQHKKSSDILKPGQSTAMK
jgi:hypothetical protein